MEDSHETLDVSVRNGILLAFFSVTLVVCGCAGKSDSDRVQLTGKVSYKGSPVTGGDINFHPIGKGTPTNLKIGADGTLKITGVDPGEYKVVINTDPIKGSSAPAPAVLGKDTKDGQPQKGMPKDMVPPKDMATGPPGGLNIDQSKMGVQPVYVAIPAKYKAVNTTPLTITLSKGKQEKDFELVD